MSTRFIQGTPVNYQGRTDGVAVAAGYIGQEIISTVSAVSAPAASQRGDITTISLTAGVWEVTANASLARNSATYAAAPQVLVSIITATGNSGTGEVNGVNYVFWDGCFSTTYTAVNFVFPSLRVYCDGANITIAGTTTAGTTLRLKGFAGAYATATPQFSAILRAVRIA